MRDLFTFIGAYVFALHCLAGAVCVLRALLALRWRRLRLLRGGRCPHAREAIDRSTWATVALRCLDCGRRRTLGRVWFGASNAATGRRHA